MNFSTLDTSAFSALPLFGIGVIHASSPTATVVANGAAIVLPLT